MFGRKKGRKSSEARASVTSLDQPDGPVLNPELLGAGSQQNTKNRDNHDKQHSNVVSIARAAKIKS